MSRSSSASASVYTDADAVPSFDDTPMVIRAKIRRLPN
jgi:hypothetical protein